MSETDRLHHQVSLGPGQARLYGPVRCGIAPQGFPGSYRWQTTRRVPPALHR